MLSRKTIQLLAQINHQMHCRNGSHLAFIGTGNMGTHMARHLIAKGEKVKVYDVLAANAASVPGAEVCASPQEAAADASVIFTMLPNGAIVKEAVAGAEGVLRSARKAALLVDCSTIEPQDAQEVGRLAAAAGVRFLDAPVSGGVTGAAAGTLCFMVGGEAALVRAAEPHLLKMGAKVFHCGATGAGQMAKLCNNLILAVTMIGTCEGMNLGVKLGLDPKVLTDIVNVSTGRSWSSEIYNPVPGIIPTVPSSNDYKGGFSVKLISKDLGLAQSAAVSCDAPVPLGAAAHQIYRTLIANGEGGRDFSYVYKLLKGTE